MCAQMSQFYNKKLWKIIENQLNCEQIREDTDIETMDQEHAIIKYNNT